MVPAVRVGGWKLLTLDFKDTNIVKPDVVAVTQRFRDLYDQNIAPPVGAYDYDTGPDAFVGAVTVPLGDR